MTVVRYFNVYGPAQDWRRTIPPLMSAFVINLLWGFSPVIYSSGEKRREFVYVDDVTDFNVLAMTHPSTDGGVFNVGSGVNHSVNEIHKAVETLRTLALSRLSRQPPRRGRGDAGGHRARARLEPPRVPEGGRRAVNRLHQRGRSA